MSEGEKGSVNSEMEQDLLKRLSTLKDMITEAAPAAHLQLPEDAPHDVNRYCSIHPPGTIPGVEKATGGVHSYDRIVSYVCGCTICYKNRHDVVPAVNFRRK